jgi:glycosyltransferase involved in cell wall biosynthesis
MKLLVITTSYPDMNAGEAAAGNFVVDFARNLADLNVQTTVVAPAAEDRAGVEAGVDVRRFRVPRLPLSHLSPRSPEAWPAIIRTLAAGRRAVDRIAAEKKPDHILALWVLPSGWWAMRAARRHQIPFSTWALGSDIWTLGKVPLVRSLLSHVLRRAQFRFADGLKLSRDAEALGGRPCGFLPTCRRLYPAGPKTLRQIPPYRLAYLGRWHPNKGTDLLLEALGVLNDEDWRSIEAVRICGGGPLEPGVRMGAARLASSGRPVSLGGYLDQEGARDLFAWADFVLIPSRIESIPVVFSDALQMNCPVIATPVGDLPRLLKEYPAGILVEEAAPWALARGIRLALQRRPKAFAEGMAEARAVFDPLAAARRCLDTIHSPSAAMQEKSWES